MRLGYARVSTASGEQLAALGSQRGRLIAAGCEEVIEDVQSGRESDRAGLLRVLELVRSGEVTELVITRVDRLGRDATDTDATIAFCAKHRCVIRALDGGTIESETPAGFLMSRVMTSLAEMESRMLSQRIRAGLEERRERAMPLRGRAPWGYRIAADKTCFEPHPTEFPRAKRFLRVLRAADWRMETALDTWESMGEEPLPLGSNRAVRAWLINPVTRGGTGYQQKPNHVFQRVVWGTHPPLLRPEEWDTIQRILAINRSRWGHNARVPAKLLNGLCRCAACGYALTYAPSRRIPSVICRHRGCEHQYRGTRQSVIVEAINEALRSRALDLAQLVSDEPPELAELRHQIASLEAMGDPDLLPAIEAKRARMQELHKRPTPDPQLLAKLRCPKSWADYGEKELRLLYLETVQKVVVAPRQVLRVELVF